MSKPLSKEQLEAQKIELEIKKLKRSFWQTPSMFIPLLIPLLAILITYYINKDYINLKLEVKKLTLEKEGIELEEKKKQLSDQINNQNNLIKEYSAINDSLKRSIIISNDKLVGLSSRNDSFETVVESLSVDVHRKKADIVRIKNVADSISQLSEHRLHFIAMEKQFQLLESIRSYAEGSFRAYKRVLSGNKAWYQWRKHKHQIDTALIYNNTSYEYNDTLQSIRKQMLEVWISTRKVLFELDELIDGSMEFNIKDYMVRLDEAEKRYSIFKFNHLCRIDYYSLQLMCEEK